MKFILILLSLIISMPSFAKIEARFVPNPVRSGQSVELIFSSDKEFQHQPNLTVLEKDFLIGGQSRRKSAQWINGKGSTSYELAYTLFPNKSGKIVIDQLKVGTENIDPLTLTVSGQATTAPQLQLSVNCPADAADPSQKIVCLATLTDQAGITEGQIIPPATDAGSWEQVQQLQPIQRNSNNVVYQAAFAFTPKDGGAINMNPFTFQGAAILDTRPQNTSYHSLLDFMVAGFGLQATQPVSVSSPTFTIHVKEKPKDYEGWWLPSTQVALTENYQIPDKIMVGEPIIRTVTLTARNVPATQMPVPTAPMTNGIKVYTNPEKRQDSGDTGSVSVEMTFVPTEDGTLTLPEIRVPWFDTQTAQTKMATLPAKQITVIAESPVGTAPTPVATQPVPVQPVAAPEQLSAPTSIGGLSLTWVLVAAGLAFVLGIILTALIFLRLGHRSTKREKKKPLPDLYPF